MSENYEKTTVLFEKAQNGNSSAREELYRRILPRLESFARGRVPVFVQNVTDTQEIVQDTVLRALPRMQSFKPRHEGALLHYLQRILVNRIRDLARRGGREVPIEDESLIASKESQSPISRLVGEETLRKFAKALASLKSDQRTAVSLYVEMGYSLDELAVALDRGTEAARKLLARGLQNVAEKMKARS